MGPDGRLSRRSGRGTVSAPAQLSRTRRDVLVSVAALALLLAWEASGLDLTLAGWFADAAGFAARDAWWSRHLLHDGGRWLAAGALLVATIAASMRDKGQAMPRRTRLAWLLAVLVALVLVPALKRFSHSSCPWDLLAFGGSVPYVPHWLLGVVDGGPGHCFPSGHAVAAFAFLPLYFQWRVQRPVLARGILSAVLIAGALLGWAQLARGAHFPSHTLWSAWLCWVVGCVAARILERRYAATAGSGSSA